MNGLDAATILRKKLPRTPIILYTMHVGAGVERVAAAAGITAVVSKGDPVGDLLTHEGNHSGGGCLDRQL